MFADDVNPILEGLQEQGLVELEVISHRKHSHTQKKDTFDKVSVTDAGAAANLWTAGEGICIGHRVVEKIVRFTYADQGSNKNAAEVEYTWKLSGFPSWFDPKHYPSVRGVNTAVEGSASLQKSSDGWHVLFAM